LFEIVPFFLLEKSLVSFGIDEGIKGSAGLQSFHLIGHPIHGGVLGQKHIHLQTPENAKSPSIQIPIDAGSTHEQDRVGLPILLDRCGPGRATLRVSGGQVGLHGDAS
jgi:hypothetical protein